MTPIKKDLLVLEFNMFFNITNINERWKIYWPILRKDGGVRIYPEYIVGNRK